MSLEYFGVRKIVVVNGHGENLAALSELGKELREEGVFLSVFQWWPAALKLLPGFFVPDERRHAGAEETSMNLAMHPKLVDMKKALDEELSRDVLQVEGFTLPLSTVDETNSGSMANSQRLQLKRAKESLNRL